MNDEAKKEGERIVASESLEKFLGDVDFGKYTNAGGKSYYEGVLLKNLKTVMSYLIGTNLSAKDIKNLDEDIKELTESREKVLKGEGGNLGVLVNIRIPGFESHNLCFQLDIGGVGHEISLDMHQFMDIVAPEIKDKSGNIPTTMLWIGFLEENKKVDQNSGSLFDTFVTKLDDIVPSYHPRMREKIPNYLFGN